MFGLRLGWPQVVLSSVAIVSLAAVYIFVGEEDRSTIERGVLAVWVFVSSFLGPALRRHEGEAESE